MNLRILLLTLCLLLSSPLLATHFMGGFISIQKVDPTNSTDLTYNITLHTFTDPAPTGVDRCSADILIYTNASPVPFTTLENIPRANDPLMTNIPGDCDLNPGDQPANGEVFYGTVKENIYTTQYTFPGPGDYTLIANDLALFGGLANVTDPESQPGTVVGQILVTPPLFGANQAPIFLNRPRIGAVVGQPFTYLPGAYDADGDSLSYGLVPAVGFDENSAFGSNNPAPLDGYRFPDHPDFGQSTLTVDPLTGMIT